MINYREMKRRFDLDGCGPTVEHLVEALREGDLRPDEFSLRDLAEALIPDGREWVRLLHPNNQSTELCSEQFEDADLSAFQNVVRQVIQSKIHESFQHEAFVLSKLVATIPTRLDGEKIQSNGAISGTLDDVETPSTSKRGFIVPVTREAVFFDRTHLVLRRAAEVGELLGLDKEKRLLDLMTGTTNNHKWRGTAYDTYQSSTPWVNVLTDNELVDWTNVDAAEQLFADMLDPATGEPVLVRAKQVIVMPAYRHAASRIFNDSESGLTGNYRVFESRLAYRRILASGVAAVDAKQWWFVGDIKRAFAYMENWPLTVVQSSLGSEAEFSHDIVLRFKASERGAAAVLNPRYVVKCTGPVQE